jgi:3-hydroxybutyryl-CoA dehydratase
MTSLWKGKLKLKYKIGQTFTKNFAITEEKVNNFASTTGDMNPIHIDEEYAKESIFKKRISHGMLVASHISNVLANDLPGPGTIYLSQTLSFKRPVFIGDIITVKVEITKIREDKNIMFLKTDCLNEQEKIVIEGESCVKFD